MTAALILLTVAAGALWGLCRAPVVTVLAVAAIGALTARGVVPVPAAVAEPFRSAQADVRAWQDTQAGRIVCERRSMTAVMNEDETQMAAADAVCEQAWSGR